MAQTPAPPKHKATPMIANTNTPVALQTSASLNRRAVSGGKSSTHIPFRILEGKDVTIQYDKFPNVGTKTLPHGGKPRSGHQLFSRDLSQISGETTTSSDSNEEKLK